MPSKTSFFNKTVFWSDLRRYWPLTAGYALLWFLLLPFSRLTVLENARGMHSFEVLEESLQISATGGCWSAFILGILFAMAMFSYLTNPRATNGLHALPARRETLYLTHYLAGLCAQLVPQLAAVALTAVVLGSHNAFDARTMGLSLLALVLPTLFFYSFGVFCMMFTGQILAAPVFYGVLNVLVVGVEMLVRELAGSFLYGWSNSYSGTLEAFSPIVKLVDVRLNAYTSVLRHDPARGDFTRIDLQGLGWLLLYAGVGLVFAALGLLVYRKRHSEATGSTVAIGWARPIFKYGVTFCAALAVGQGLYQIFFGRFRTRGSYSLSGMLLCMAASGLIGYFVSEMLLKKSLRVWRSGWKGALTVTGVLLALGVAMSFDLTGYEGYVPEADEIEYAHIMCSGFGGAWFGGAVDGAETLRRVTDAHRAVVNDKRDQRAFDENIYGVYADPRTGELLSSGDFQITYHMKDGRTVIRDYDDLVISARELNDPASPAAALTALYNDRSLMISRVLDWSAYEMTQETLAQLRVTGGTVTMYVYNEKDGYTEEMTELRSTDAQAVFDAILRDVEAGRSENSLFSAQEEFVWMDGDIQFSASPAPGTPATGTDMVGPNGEKMIGITLNAHVAKSMTETVAALRKAGIEPAF